MGFCEYVFSKDKVQNRFEVLTKNEPCNNRYSCVASVTVFIKELKLKITRGGKFTVFGIPKEVTQPYFNKGVMVRRKEKGIQINTDVGVTVEYDGVFNVFVTIHSRYREMTAGLCGNYNGDINDEYIGQNSHLSDSIVDFTDSWKVDQSCPNSPIPENPCLTTSSIAQDAKMKC
ncbi:Hypothetical predicted protein [Paramuricea clavata]|uniref:Uncharacterized protein n=1 Tax=Paramuricea clavata TaxID=317549 RepID=A0A7D9J193_PARCT|nr:Hypothetical predicted protein [Paramuricea clavata]